MASLNELSNELPAKYSLSNKNIIFIAHILDETIYFFNFLGPLTTIVLLSCPKCIGLKNIFLNFMNDFGTTVIDLHEPEIFDPLYKLSFRSEQIIKTLLTNHKFKRIITHPQYPTDNDPQNRALYDIVHSIVTEHGLKNHYVYAQGPSNITQTQMHLMVLYSNACITNYKHNELLKKYIDITTHVNGLKLVS